MERGIDVNVRVMSDSRPACVWLGSSSPPSWLLFEERDAPRGDGGGGVTSRTSDKNTDEVTPPEGSPSFLNTSGKKDNKFNIDKKNIQSG